MPSLSSKPMSCFSIFLFDASNKDGRDISDCSSLTSLRKSSYRPTFFGGLTLFFTSGDSAKVSCVYVINVSLLGEASPFE